VENPREVTTHNAGESRDITIGLALLRPGNMGHRSISAMEKDRSVEIMIWVLGGIALVLSLAILGFVFKLW
jgi:hypothetical protein